MAIGAVTGSETGVLVEILASATAANNPPSGANAGIAMSTLRTHSPGLDTVRVAVASTAGSDTMTVTLRLWMYVGSTWFVAKALNASSAAPHTAVAIPETGTDSIAYSEIVSGLKVATRLYLEIVAIAGTSTAVTGYAIVPQG